MLSLPSRLTLLFVLASFCLPAWAAKTDIVYLKNGDRVTGEVKNLERGKLEFKTDHMGTVQIDWEDILEVVSSTGQTVELANGQRFYGPLAKSENPDMVMVNTDVGSVGVSTEDVVSMYPVEAGFWDRLDISADLGFSWDKASNVGKYSVGVQTELRSTRFISRASFSSEITTQHGREDTNRSNLNAMHNVFHPNKRFHAIFGNIENNNEIGLDLRALVGAGYGVVPFRNQRHWLALGGGLAASHEIPTSGEQQENLEATGLLSYDYFKYSAPERSFTTTMAVFPSLSDWGRWRANLDTNFRFELVSDLYWRMSLYISYDSDPIVADASSSDYGLTSSLGYKF